MRFYILIILIISLLGCNKKEDQEVLDATDYALTLLTKNKCQDAIDILEDVGRQQDNSIYLQVLASAYACRAGFSEITFLASDIEKIETTSEDFMPSLTTLSSSNETEADSDSYTDLNTALDILLNITSAQPSQIKRNESFGARKAGDMGLQALLISVAQLGKFLDYYGNVDASGAKGQGGGVNECLITYSYNQAQLYLNGTGDGGVCDNIATDVGHPDLSLASGKLTATKRRMCEGLMLVTNIIDIINNIELSSNSSVEKLQDIVSTIDEFRDFVTTTAPELATLLDITSQDKCEEIVEESSEFDNLQLIFALMFERGLP